VDERKLHESRQREKPAARAAALDTPQAAAAQVQEVQIVMTIT